MVYENGRCMARHAAIASILSVKSMCWSVKKRPRANGRRKTKSTIASPHCLKDQSIQKSKFRMTIAM